MLTKEDGMQAAKAANDANAAPNDNPMANKIGELIQKIAQGIEDKLGVIANIKAVGGPYEASLTIVAERKLLDAASEALRIIVKESGLHTQG